MGNRNKHMQKFVDNLAEEFFGRSDSEAKEKGICVMCGNPVGEFRDELSKKEYDISSMCQKCQDEVFGIERI